MGGQSKQTSNTQQVSNSQPWFPTLPALNSIVSNIQGQIPNYQPTGAENQAFQQLQTNAQNLPNYAPQAQDLTNKFLTGDPTGLLNPALQNYNNVLNPIANANLDPTKTPGIQNLLDTIRSDVSNSVNSQFAGAGRDLSGLNTQTLARGISQGEAAPLLAQYNQNVSNATNAASGLYNAAGTTASAIGQNQGNAFNFANMIPALQNASPLGVINAASMQRAAPLQNLGMLANLTVPIAGLGQQNAGQSWTTQQSIPGPMQTVAGWGNALGGANGGGALGSAGKIAGILSMFG